MESLQSGRKALLDALNKQWDKLEADIGSGESPE